MNVSPRTSRRAIASLVCSLLVIPSLVWLMLFLVPTVSPGRLSMSVRSWNEFDETTGEAVYYLEYAYDGGPKKRLGPSPTPLSREDIPASGAGPGLVKVMAVTVLLVPSVLVLLAIALGVSALRAVTARPNELRGRSLAFAGLVIAGLDGTLLLLGGAAFGLLAIAM